MQSGSLFLCWSAAGGGGDPLTPNDEIRISGDFEDVWDIFGQNWEDNPLDPQLSIAQEVDLAPLVWGNSSTNPGDLVTEQDGNSFVAAVSRVDETLLGVVVSSRIELKMFAMRQHPITHATEPVMYNMEGNEYWGNEMDYRFNIRPGHVVSQPGEEFCQTPRVIARALHWSYGDLIFEVHVAYEVIDDPITISVYRGIFIMDFLFDGSINIELYGIGPDSWTEVSSGSGQDYLFPDLEYSPSSGYTHLVYTAFELVQGEPSAKIYYEARQGSTGPFLGWVWLNEDDGGTNGWIPRIDVGTVTDPFHFATQGDVMTVAVVYTRQEIDPGDLFYGYRPYVRYWREEIGPVPIVPPETPPELWVDSHQLPIVNGEWEPPQSGGYHGSGMPVIDIAPESNDNHDAFVSFVQQISTLPDPIRHAVYLVGHAFQGAVLEVEFHAVSGTLEGTSVLPAMCVHYGTRQLSVTYYHQCNAGGGPWTVIANRVDYLEEDPIFNHTIIDAEAHGSFNIAELANYNFGVASGLAATVTENHPSYFAAWSDSVGIVCEPCHIQATFGFTDII